MDLTATISSDLDTIFDNDFTISATHTYSGNDEALKVLFDVSSELALSGAVVVSEQSASIQLKTADAGNITKDSQFNINNTIYKVFEIQPNIEGVTKIILTEATP